MTASQIVQTIDKYGNDVLGFTVQYNEDSFCNVMRYFSADNFEHVLKGLTEDRKQILINGKTKEKRK